MKYIAMIMITAGLVMAEDKQTYTPTNSISMEFVTLGCSTGTYNNCEGKCMAGQTRGIRTIQ